MIDIKDGSYSIRESYPHLGQGPGPTYSSVIESAHDNYGFLQVQAPLHPSKGKVS